MLSVEDHDDWQSDSTGNYYENIQFLFLIDLQTLKIFN